MKIDKFVKYIVNIHTHACVCMCLCMYVHTGDWFGTSGASLGEKFAKAIGAIWFVIARRKSLACQRIIAVAASEAISVPRLVLICHSTAGDYLWGKKRKKSKKVDNF